MLDFSEVRQSRSRLVANADDLPVQDVDLQASAPTAASASKQKGPAERKKKSLDIDELTAKSLEELKKQVTVGRTMGSLKRLVRTVAARAVKSELVIGRQLKVFRSACHLGDDEEGKEKHIKIANSKCDR